MTRRMLGIAVVVVAIFAGATDGAAQSERAAQSDGMGPLLDWIHKLSGPRFIGVGLTGYHEWGGEQLANARAGYREPGIRLRLGATYHWSIAETGEVVPDTANLTMITFQGGVEIPVTRYPFEFGIGAALHRFGGDASSFWHVSVPVLVQYRPRKESRRFVPRVGVALHVFPGFGVTDFAPLDVDVSRDGAEAVLQFFVAFDRRW